MGEGKKATKAERLRLAIPWDEYERCTEPTARAEYERRVRAIEREPDP